MTSTTGAPDRPEFSLLTGAGIAQIKDSQLARFDLRDLTLTNVDAGLPADHKKDVIIGGAGEPDIELTLVGPEGHDSIATQTIWIVHNYTGDGFDYLTFWRSFNTPEGARQELAQATTRWGIQPENVDTWTSIASKAGKEKEKWNLGAGVGTTGLIVDLNASIKNRVQVFQYFVLLDPRKYTPENLASIRASGISQPISN